MAVNVPGLSLSILRQQTSVQAGLPLLISGRFTAFGIGLPVFIRVFLEGPSYDPQVRSFDTFASPFSGDYSVNVIAEKDGSYNVYAQASPPPLVPTGPPFPEALLLLPPMAESTRPPLVVGSPFDGGVSALMPDGTTQQLSAPPLQPIEFRPYITVGAPGITITVPGAGVPGVPALPYYPPAAPAAVAPAVPVTGLVIAQAAIDDIRFSPSEINPGQEALGVMTWRNTGDAPQLFDTALYLISPTGARYGPLQVYQDLSAHPQVPNTQNIRLGTQGLPSGFYNVLGEIYDITTGTIIAAREVAGRLSIREIAPPVAPPPPVPLPPVPEIPEVIPTPPPPVVPEVPTMELLGTPNIIIPRQLNVGEVLTGYANLPSIAPVPLYAEASLFLRDQAGQEYNLGQAGRTIQPGETLQVPFNMDTTGFPPGDYAVLLRVYDQFGALVAEFPLGFIRLLEAIVPPVPPVVPAVPELPTLPTTDMFQTPFDNLRSELEIGEIWQGDITVPTKVPPSLQQLLSAPPGLPGVPAAPFAVPAAPLAVPSFPVNIGLQLENPASRLFPVGSYRPTFTPGQPFSLPVNFDTSVLPEEGIHNLFMNIQDIQGNTLFDNKIGELRALMPELPVPPEIPPVMPELSEFPSIAVNLGTSQVEMDGSLSIPITYNHVGAPETVILYAAIGDDRPAWLGGLDEVWHAEKTISVPLDVAPTPRSDRIDIPITPKFRAAGIYSVYAKIMGRGLPFRDVISPTLRNIVEVLAPPELPAPPPLPAISQFTSIRVNISPQQVGAGDPLVVPASIIHVGGAEDVTLYAAIGNYGRFGFNEVLHASKRISVPFDANPTARADEVIIPITTALRPGYYDVYAKITGKLPETISEPVQNVIEFVAAPEVPLSQFPSCSVSISRQRLKEGDTLTVPVRFVHIGQRERIRIYAAIGNHGALGFNEVLHGSTDWVVPDDMTSQARTVNVSIQITSAIRPAQVAAVTGLVIGDTGIYDVYGKVMRVQTGRGEIVSEPVQNIIEIYAPVTVGPSQFSNVWITPGVRTVRHGANMGVLVHFTHVGEAESEWLYAAVGNAGVFGFDEILSNRKSTTVDADPQPKEYVDMVTIPITTAIRTGSYDLYAKIGLGATPKAISPTLSDVVRVY